ncbi:MAG: transglutaminase-like domain-containing protein [Leptospirales bacterium]|nr:transglutaminase-like domain-containing protein [Leptospirales bacterium]
MTQYKSLYRTCIILAYILICSEINSLPISSFFVKPSGINSSAYTGSKAVYKIESSDEDFNIPNTANQIVLSESIKNNKKEIVISCGENKISGSRDLNLYLNDTQFLNLDDPNIKKTAAGFKNSKNKIKDVSRFVYTHISDKKIGMPLIPAASILKSKAGDCTEHSVLTISILRSLNIPSRAVVGLILSEKFFNEENVFVYHMWVEAYENNRWILVDSTRPNSINPNRYIALCYHSLKTEAPLEYLTAMSRIQDLKITYVKD